MRTKRIRREIKSVPFVGFLILVLTCGTVLAEATRLKVGVYDSRGVALAYGGSAENMERFRKLRADHRAAEAAGDTAKVRELETYGPWLQERMHMQGFGNLPVDDILEGREAMLAEVARETGVYIVVPSVDYKGPYVEIVDVTEAIAVKFGSDEKTPDMIRKLDAYPPVELPFDFSDD